MKFLGFLLLVVLLLLILVSIKILDVVITAALSVFGIIYVAWFVTLIFFD